MNSPEKSEVKDTSKLFLSILVAGQVAILGAAVLFAVENPKEINNSPAQTVGYQNHSIDTIVNK